MLLKHGFEVSQLTVSHTVHAKENREFLVQSSSQQDHDMEGVEEGVPASFHL